MEEVVYQIREGDHSGSVEWGETTVLNGKEVAEALIAQGSDPGFFGLTEEGEEVEEDYGN